MSPGENITEWLLKRTPLSILLLFPFYSPHILLLFRSGSGRPYCDLFLSQTKNISSCFPILLKKYTHFYLYALNYYWRERCFPHQIWRLANVINVLTSTGYLLKKHFTLTCAVIRRCFFSYSAWTKLHV